MYNIFLKLLINNLAFFYRFRYCRTLVLKFIVRLEGGLYFSNTLRHLLKKYHEIDIGSYTYGPCLTPGKWPKAVSVGRYTSIADSVQVFRRNHPMERISMHPFFYNSVLNIVDKDNIDEFPLEIGHDVWIGGNVIITAGCGYIGNGAVIAAGAVVTKNIPEFSVWGGVPAQCIKMRFDESTIEKINKIAWWNKDVSVLIRFLPYFEAEMNELAISELSEVFEKFGQVKNDELL